MSNIEIPGFYYDADRRKYFKITINTEKSNYDRTIIQKKQHLRIFNENLISINHRKDELRKNLTKKCFLNEITSMEAAWLSKQIITSSSILLNNQYYVHSVPKHLKFLIYNPGKNSTITFSNYGEPIPLNKSTLDLIFDGYKYQILNLYHYGDNIYFLKNEKDVFVINRFNIDFTYSELVKFTLKKPDIVIDVACNDQLVLILKSYNEIQCQIKGQNATKIKRLLFNKIDKTDILAMSIMEQYSECSGVVPLHIFLGCRNGSLYRVAFNNTAGFHDYQLIHNFKSPIISISITSNGDQLISVVGQPFQKLGILKQHGVKVPLKILFKTRFQNFTRNTEILNVSSDGNFFVYGSTLSSDFEIFSLLPEYNLIYDYEQDNDLLIYYPWKSKADFEEFSNLEELIGICIGLTDSGTYQLIITYQGSKEKKILHQIIEI